MTTPDPESPSSDSAPSGPAPADAEPARPGSVPVPPFTGPRFSPLQKLGIAVSVVLSGLLFIGVVGAALDPNAGRTAPAGAAAAPSPETVAAVAPSPSPTVSLQPTTLPPAPEPSPPPTPAATAPAATTPAPEPPPAPAPTPTRTRSDVPTAAAPAPAPARTTAVAPPAGGSCAAHTTGACGWDVGVPPVQSGETATCRDGSASFSATFSGTCSHHGGVEYWYK